MATNPDNAIGTNGAYGGRTSVNALNDVLSVFNGRGVIQGWELLPSAGMTITAGGDGSTRDVAIAEDNIGNKTTINNISEAPVPVTISAAPVSNSRIDLVVAYVDNPPQGTSTVTDNYGACGIIVVSGTAAASPTAPSEADIRTAITADGGAGTVAYYVVLGSVTVASGTTDITNNMITAGDYSGITSQNVDFTTYSKIVASLSSNTSVSVSSQNIYTSNQVYIKGNGLSIDANGRIAVGGTIGTVRIGGMVTFSGAVPADAIIHMAVIKNGSVVVGSARSDRTRGTYDSIMVDGVITDVKDGDTINISGYVEGSSAIALGGASYTRIWVEEC